MILPEATKVEFWQDLKVYEEERKMPYITSVEQIGYDRGQVVGYDRGQVVGYDRGVEAEAERSRKQLLEAQQSLIIRQLTRKIGSVPVNAIDRINTLSVEQLGSLGEELFDFESIVDLNTWLDNQHKS